MDFSDNSQGTELESKVAKVKPKRYYGVSALFILACSVIYIMPHWDHYMMGGMQGFVLLIFIGIILLVVDIVLLFILAAILRRIMRRRWAKWVPIIGLGILAIFLTINMYRSTLPLPYLQYMIDSIPDAVEYFDAHETEFNAEVASKEDRSFDYDAPDKPSGPMVNMQYVYVENPNEYPQKVGQISRIEYIHPLNERWYLRLYQRYAA